MLNSKVMFQVSCVCFARLFGIEVGSVWRTVSMPALFIDILFLGLLPALSADQRGENFFSQSDFITTELIILLLRVPLMVPHLPPLAVKLLLPVNLPI